MLDDSIKGAKFSTEYLDYWKKRVNSSPDGTNVADNQIQEQFINLLDINPDDKVLDLGCSFGRLCQLLKRKTVNVFGLDVDYEVIDDAMKEPYVLAIKGSAENTHFPSGFFDKIIAWAVYDVVEQNEALHEAYRILKPEGKLLFTGKNNNYSTDDHLAFVAERNAKLKNFPNHFTDVYLLLDNLAHFGFRMYRCFVFERRGDFAKNRYIDIFLKRPEKFYEYLLIVERLSEKEPSLPEIGICYAQSLPAQKMAKAQGYENITGFFERNISEEKRKS